MKKLISSDYANVTAIRKRVKGGQSVFVEGFANRFSDGEKKLIDRGSDLIEPSAWKLDNFLNNPIIFFNHDRMKPIGKATKVEVTEQGLRVKVKLSDSADPEISRVRDLVSEGILKSFSVGFDPKKIDKEVIDGREVSMIKDAELLEVSVVSIPMAEHSLFDVTAKSLAEMPYSEAKRICLLGKQEDEDEDETEETEDEDGKQEISSQPSEAQLSSPTLDAIRQTNILLAQLIAVNTSMGEKIEQAFKPNEEEEISETPDDEETEEPEESAEETEETEDPPAEAPAEDDEDEDDEDKTEDEDADEDDEEKPKGFKPDQVKTLAKYLERAEGILKKHGL